MTRTKHSDTSGTATYDGADGSEAAFLAWGDDVIAYVKAVEIEGESSFAIHAADGRPLGVVRADRDEAFAVVRQNELEPVSVH